MIHRWYDVPYVANFSGLSSLIAPSILSNVYLQVVKMMTVIVGGLVISLKIIVIYTNVRLLELATLYH